MKTILTMNIKVLLIVLLVTSSAQAFDARGTCSISSASVKDRYNRVFLVKLVAANTILPGGRRAPTAGPYAFPQGTIFFGSDTIKTAFVKGSYDALSAQSLREDTSDLLLSCGEDVVFSNIGGPSVKTSLCSLVPGAKSFTITSRAKISVTGFGIMQTSKNYFERSCLRGIDETP